MMRILFEAGGSRVLSTLLLLSALFSFILLLDYNWEILALEHSSVN